MKRPYKDGEHNDVVYYTGINVEKTPAFGKKTLYVMKKRPAKMIIDIARDRECTHIYFGAQGSFKPAYPKQWAEYELLVNDLTSAGFFVTVEHDIKYSEDFLDSEFVENNMCIPVLSITVPYLEQYRYNGCVKFNDSGFDKTNAGVWVHSLHSITATSAFTHWADYKDDLPI